MGLLGPLSQLLRRPAAKAFERASRQPREAQEQKLLRVLAANQDTAYGRQFGFGRIRCARDYQQTVPIVTYADLQLWMDRLQQGEPNLLTREDPIFFGMTTGSTGSPKLTPITPAYREEYQAVVHTFLYHVYRDHPRAFAGKVLYFHGSADKGRTPSGLPCGTMSGFNFVSLPPLVKKFYAVPYEVNVLGDGWTRNYITALLALPQPISMVIGITGAPIIALFQTLQKEAPALLKDLHDGTLPRDLDLPGPVRQVIQTRLKPHPARARELERYLSQSARPQDLWPGLELLICWKSSHAGGFIPGLEALVEGQIPIRDAIYSATEGWCNIPCNDTLIGGPLALNAHFYEFIPEEDESSQPLLAHELEQGRRYRILYTTSAGLYRYDIGDILEVDGCFNHTPCVRFVRKRGQTCNLVGELMTDFHITEAVLQTARELGLAVPFYAAVPDQGRFPPRYTFLLELPQSLEASRYPQLARQLDQALSRINCDYESARHDNQLGLPALEILAPGSHQLFRQQQVQAGADEAQLKPIVLATGRERFSGLPVYAFYQEEA